MNDIMNAFKNIEIWDIWNWVVNFYPITFFGIKIPIIFLVSGILILTAIINATFKTLLKIAIVVVVIYLFSVVLGKI